MKKFLILICIAIALNSNSQTLTLDSSFGTNGFATLDGDSTGNRNLNNIIQPDGKILVCGTRTIGNQPKENFVARYNSNGTLDYNFAANGYYSIPNADYNGLSIRLLQNGKIILMLFTNIYEIRKLNSNGSIDSTFGNNGILTFNSWNGNETGGVLDSNEDLYLALHFVTYNPSYSSVYKIIKINTINGLLDNTFGNNGELIISTNRSVLDIIGIQNGKFIITTQIENIMFNLSISRINNDGTTDLSFGNNGFVDLYTPNTNTEAKIEFDNDFLVTVRNNNDNVFNLLNNYDSDGHLIPTFGSNGTTNININDIPMSIKKNNGKIYLLGVNYVSFSPNLSLSRYLNSGMLDQTFNSTGNYYENTNLLEEWSRNFKFNNDGSLIVVGEYNNGSFSRKIFLAKYNQPNLSLNDLNKYNVSMNNPVIDILKIETIEEIKLIVMFSLIGEKICESNQKTIDLSSFTKGIYLVKIEFQNGDIIIRKILKN